jgi:hypothetical protein
MLNQYLIAFKFQHILTIIKHIYIILILNANHIQPILSSNYTLSQVLNFNWIL